MSSLASISTLCEDDPRDPQHSLTEAQNTSGLVVRLTYVALFYNSDDFSKEIFCLKERVREELEAFTRLLVQGLEELN